MDRYDIILEALQELVDVGELTLEEAELVNEAAYDKYVVEGNAYNKYMNKKQDKYNDLVKKSAALSKINDGTLALNKKLMDLQVSADKLNSVVKCKTNQQDISDYNRRGEKPEHRDWAREQKQTWMKKHGDEGESPENQLRANRFLDAQKEIRKK